MCSCSWNSLLGTSALNQCPEAAAAEETKGIHLLAGQEETQHPPTAHSSRDKHLLGLASWLSTEFSYLPLAFTHLRTHGPSRTPDLCLCTGFYSWEAKDVLGFRPLWGDRVVGMDLTCATSTPFLAALCPLEATHGSHLHRAQQNYITGGPVKPMSHGLTTGN